MVGGHGKASFDSSHESHHAKGNYGFGSILRGFSRDVLASVWGVDESFLESLLQRQVEVGIIKVQQRVQFHEHLMKNQDMVQKSSFLPSEVMIPSTTSNTCINYSGCPCPCIPTSSMELTYNIHREQFDHFVEGGGWFRLINNQKFPILHHVGFSVGHVSLNGVSFYLFHHPLFKMSSTSFKGHIHLNMWYAKHFDLHSFLGGYVGTFIFSQCS